MEWRSPDSLIPLGRDAGSSNSCEFADLNGKAQYDGVGISASLSLTEVARRVVLLALDSSTPFWLTRS